MNRAPGSRAALMVGCIALFAALAAAVVALPGITRLDQLVLGWFGPYRVEPWLTIFLWITTLGTGAALVAVMLTSSALLWACRRRALLLPLWVCYLGAEATTWLVKFAIDRVRPDFIAAATAVSPSFPSAHAAGSAAVYGCIAYLVVRELLPGRWDRPAAAIGSAALIALIGFSRVFLSVHYLSDVLGGFLIAVFWLMVAMRVSDRGFHR